MATAAQAIRLPLILGSSSPRRRDLLTNVGLAYHVITPGTEEVPRRGEKPLAYVQRNSSEKAAAVAKLAVASGKFPAGFLIISADTVVVLEGDILEKPADAEHARRMLGRLSGNTHTVVSGVTLMAAGGAQAPNEETFAVTTEVLIKTLNAAEIDAYIRTGEPMDKAGGYAAQGIGSYMVERLNGSYTNVVGLPVAEVIERLGRNFAYPLWETL